MSRIDALSLAGTSLAAYATAVYPAFECAHHIRVIVKALEDVEMGKVKRLVVILPPRHGKSLLCSQIFPAWYLGRNPEKSIIAASYGESLAVDFGRQVRAFLADPAHQAIFHRCRVSSDAAAQNRLATTRGGFYYAVGRGGPVTGRGADVLVIDDLLKDHEEAHSDTIRKGTWDWVQHVALPRLTPKGALLAVGTRWHESDPLGKLIELGGCRVIHLPAINEKGEALWPSKFPLPVLQGIRSSIGERAWTSLYQGRPAAAEGSIFKREWLRYYNNVPDKFQRLIQSWDVATKTAASNDYSVCTTWATTETGYYLLGLWRGKVEFPELKKKFSDLAQEWGPDCILVEDTSAGTPLIQELMQSTTYPVIPVKATKSKELRAQACTPSFEAGKVLLPEAAPWLNDFVEELVSFPASAHDDMTDTVTQAINYLRDKGLVLGLVEFLKGIAGGLIPHPDAAPPPEPEPEPVVAVSQPKPPADSKPPCPTCGSNQFVIRCASGYSCNCCHRTFYRPGQSPEILTAGFRYGRPEVYMRRLQ